MRYLALWFLTLVILAALLFVFGLAWGGWDHWACGDIQDGVIRICQTAVH